MLVFEKNSRIKFRGRQKSSKIGSLIIFWLYSITLIKYGSTYIIVGIDMKNMVSKFYAPMQMYVRMHA